MKLIKSLPPNRTYEQVKNHFLVEKSIADRLRMSSSQNRKHIYAKMYDELFNQVPDHPRLIQKKDLQSSKIKIKQRLPLIRNYLSSHATFAEFGPGDCLFAKEVAKYVQNVYAIDISDQRDASFITPQNLTYIVYDGFQLNEISKVSVDLVFSDQLIEHLHPDDAQLHFELVYYILKPGGKYVLITPHAFSGPHDVSQFFSDKPQGFHLKEWTYLELIESLQEVGFSQFKLIWKAKGIHFRCPMFYFQLLEHFLKFIPQRYLHKFSKYMLPSVCLVAIK